MACTNPLRAYREERSGSLRFSAVHGHSDPVDLACGQCLGCRLTRSTQWAARVTHEASLYPNNCFVTLTYDDANLPADNSLNYRHFQLFLKRLRFHYKTKTIRFYMCGEYGSITQRPHYHACLFNIHFPDQGKYKQTNSNHWLFHSPTLTKLWPHGHSTIGELNFQTAAYCARYIVQKVTGDAAEGHYAGRTPEFNVMSRRPGIGSGWYDKFHTDITRHDHLIVDGREIPIPKFYDKRRKKDDALKFDDALQGRLVKALQWRADQTPERLAVKATVDRARLNFLKRTL